MRGEKNVDVFVFLQLHRNFKRGWVERKQACSAKNV